MISHLSLSPLSLSLSVCLSLSPLSSLPHTQITSKSVKIKKCHHYEIKNKKGATMTYFSGVEWGISERPFLLGKKKNKTLKKK